MYSLGALMSIPFIPTVSQYLGRRWTIVAASLIMTLGAGMQAGAVNVDMFLASRWVLGFGIPFAIVNASALIGELAYAKERPIMTSLFNASWFVGAIIAAGVTYGTFQMKSTWAWRLPSLLQFVPSACQLGFMAWCPESPRWLISKDRGDEAFAILQKYHCEGENGEEFVRLEYAQIQSTIAQEKATASKYEPGAARIPLFVVDSRIASGKTGERIGLTYGRGLRLGRRVPRCPHEAPVRARCSNGLLHPVERKRSPFFLHEEDPQPGRNHG